jgi:hypothetical protein
MFLYDKFFCRAISAGKCPINIRLYTPHHWIGDGNCCFGVVSWLPSCYNAHWQNNRTLWDLFATYLHLCSFALFVYPFLLLIRIIYKE